MCLPRTLAAFAAEPSTDDRKKWRVPDPGSGKKSKRVVVDPLLPISRAMIQKNTYESGQSHKEKTKKKGMREGTGGRFARGYSSNPKTYKTREDPEMLAAGAAFFSVNREHALPKGLACIAERTWPQKNMPPGTFDAEIPINTPAYMRGTLPPYHHKKRAFWEHAGLSHPEQTLETLFKKARKDADSASDASDSD